MLPSISRNCRFTVYSFLADLSAFISLFSNDAHAAKLSAIGRELCDTLVFLSFIFVCLELILYLDNGGCFCISIPGMAFCCSLYFSALRMMSKDGSVFFFPVLCSTSSSLDPDVFLRSGSVSSNFINIFKHLYV